MINRLRRNNIRFKGKSITPIFFDFGKLPLSVIGNFSKFYELVLFVLKKANLNKELEAYINIAGSSLTLSKNKVEYNIPIIRERVGDDIGIALNELTYALVYLINSYSFRNNSLAFFDIIEIDKRYDYSINIMEHFLKRLEA